MLQTKRQEQKKITRQRIVDTAFHLFEIQGFSTSTNIIAKEANVSHGTIFVYFPTKENLQLYVLERFAQEIGNKLHSLSVTDGGISEMLHAHINVLKEYEFFYKNLISEIVYLPDETKTILISIQSTMSLHFSKVIEKAQQAGLVKDISLHIMTNTWIGLLHYYLQNSDLFAPGTSVLSRCGDELVNSFVTLIFK